MQIRQTYNLAMVDAPLSNVSTHMIRNKHKQTYWTVDTSRSESSCNNVLQAATTNHNF